MIGGEELGGEDLGSVLAGELPRFGGRVEELLAGVGVDWEVVDGFVGGDGVRGLGLEGSGGEHGEDGVAVGFGERFALREEDVSPCTVAKYFFRARYVAVRSERLAMQLL